MAKMASKAMKARGMMKKIEAAGQSGIVSLIINGLYSVSEIEIDREALDQKIAGKSTEEAVTETVNTLKKDFADAVEDAKKQLEKEMMNATSIDDLRDMLQ